MPPKKNSSNAEDVEMKPAETEAKDVEMKPAETAAPAEPVKPAAPKEPVEPETDLPAPKAGIQDGVCINDADCTLDVFPSASKHLTALSGGGFQHLLSGARANYGIKSGRYVFEVRVLEYQNAQRQGPGPSPNQVKIGFSTAKSSLFLGSDSSDFCVDADGFFILDKKRSALGTKFGVYDTIALVLNRAAGSSCENTISVFKNGKRVNKDPIPLPEGFKGKALYPTITFKNVSMIVNFGSPLLCPLPFNAVPLQNAAKTDVEKSPVAASKDGKYEVLFPVGLPEEGAFDWLDHFLEQNPQYVELSDRSIVNWAKESGVPKKGPAQSKDKPGLSFGVPAMDDFSITKLIGSLAPVVQKNLVVMELAANLTKAGREGQLAKFNGPQFKRVATVVMGAPPSDLAAWNHAKVLEKKQKEADKAWEASKAQKLSKKQAEAQRAYTKAKQEISVKRAQRMKEKRQAVAEAIKEAKEKGIEKPEDLPKIELTPEEEEEFKMPELEKVELTVEEAGDRPTVELTEEEKKVTFSNSGLPDMAVASVTSGFASFSLPEKAEGFDDVRFVWGKANEVEPYFKDWILQKKMSQPVQNIKPGEFFTTKLKAWQDLVGPFRKRQVEFKTKGKVVIPAPPKKEGEEEEPAEEKVVNEEDPEEIDLGPVDDINDINGKGYPAYAKFQYEDWELMNIRFELHLLTHAFKHDVNDPDRPGVTEQHINHYYQAYFKKGLNLKAYACNDLKDLIKLVKDTMEISGKHSALVSKHGDDTDLLLFCKMTEENRRERQRRVDAGDETAQLKFIATPGNAPRPPSGMPPAAQNPGSRPGPTTVPHRPPRQAPVARPPAPAATGGPRWKSYAQAMTEKRTAPPGGLPPGSRPRIG